MTGNQSLSKTYSTILKIFVEVWIYDTFNFRFPVRIIYPVALWDKIGVDMISSWEIPYLLVLIIDNCIMRACSIYDTRQHNTRVMWKWNNGKEVVFSSLHSSVPGNTLFMKCPLDAIDKG